MNIEEESLNSQPVKPAHYQLTLQEMGYQDGFNCFFQGHSESLSEDFKRIKGPAFVRGWELGWLDASVEVEEDTST